MTFEMRAVLVGAFVVLLIASAFCIWFRRYSRSKCRLKAHPMIFWWLFATIVLATYVLLGLTLYAHSVQSGNILTILFGLASLVPLILGILLKRPLFPPRRIVFLGKSQSHFTRGILEGFEKEINSLATQISINFHLDILIPDKASPNESENKNYQFRMLKSSRIQEADALVIIPVRNDASVEEELLRLSRRGVFIVAIDLKIPNRPFYSSDLRMPCLVSSNFQQGGRLIAEAIQRYAWDSDACILLFGPGYSQTASLRCQSCAYYLLTFKYPGIIKASEMNDWDTESGVAAFQEAIDDLARLRKKPKKIVVFCGIDRIADAVSDRIERIKTGIYEICEFMLIGYDGLRDGSGGEPYIFNKPHCLATVDTKPEEQGHLAAQLIVDAYRGARIGEKKNLVVDPRLLVNPARITRGGAVIGPNSPTTSLAQSATTPVHREGLVQILATLAPPDFEWLVAVIPSGATHVSRHGTVPEKAAELIHWAESPTGPGLVAVRKAFAGLFEGQERGKDRTPPGTPRISEGLGSSEGRQGNGDQPRLH